MITPPLTGQQAFVPLEFASGDEIGCRWPPLRDPFLAKSGVRVNLVLKPALRRDLADQECKLSDHGRIIERALPSSGLQHPVSRENRRLSSAALSLGSSPISRPWCMTRMRSESW